MRINDILRNFIKNQTMIKVMMIRTFILKSAFRLNYHNRKNYRDKTKTRKKPTFSAYYVNNLNFFWRV